MQHSPIANGGTADGLVLAPDQHYRCQQIATVWDYRPTLLFVALRTALVGALALVLAVMPDELLCEWLTAGASVTGLVLLVIDELRQPVDGGLATAVSAVDANGEADPASRYD